MNYDSHDKTSYRTLVQLTSAQFGEGTGKNSQNIHKVMKKYKNFGSG